MKGNMMIALAAIYMLVIELLVTTAVFYMVSIWTQLPVDNNYMWIGLCILAAATSSAMIASATISITSLKK